MDKSLKIEAFDKESRENIIALRQRLDVKNWVPKDYQYCSKDKYIRSEEIKEKITVGLLHCEETSYNMIHSLYYAFENDNLFDVVVILQGRGYRNTYKELENQMKNKGMNYEFDFRCTDKKFDFLIVHHVQLPPTEDVKKIINNSVLRIAVPVGVVNYGSVESNIGNIQQYQASEIFVEQSIYNTFSKSIRSEFRCHVTGNPKFDCIYNAYLHKVKIEDKFKKLKNSQIKKIILWTTDHNGCFKICSPDVAFDLYANFMFKYARDHKDIGLIFRPYRAYVYELMRDSLWTEEQVEFLKTYCDQSENIVWDDEPDYSISYSMADAILADAGCGIICSALPMMKPIGITLRWDMDMKDVVSNNLEICNAHYLISSEKEMLSFIKMIEEEKDPNANKREEVCKKYVTHFDGKNGERIKDILIKEYQKINERFNRKLR